jgi:hypothetical protein
MTTTDEDEDDDHDEDGDNGDESRQTTTAQWRWACCREFDRRDQAPSCPDVRGLETVARSGGSSKKRRQQQQQQQQQQEAAAAARSGGSSSSSSKKRRQQQQEEAAAAAARSGSSSRSSSKKRQQQQRAREERDPWEGEEVTSGAGQPVRSFVFSFVRIDHPEGLSGLAPDRTTPMPFLLLCWRFMAPLQPTDQRGKEDLVKRRAGGGEGTCADGRGYTPGKHDDGGDDGGDDDWIDSWKRRRRRRGQRRRRGRAGRRRAEFACLAPGRMLRAPSMRRRKWYRWIEDRGGKVKIGSCVGVKRQAGPGPG